MMHPDVQDALVEIATDLTGPEHVYQHLEPGFEANLPAVLITAAQNDEDYLAQHTASLEIYHTDVPSARTLARTLVAHLTAGPHMTDAGMLDQVQLDIGVKQVPYASPDMVLCTCTLKIDTRAI